MPTGGRVCTVHHCTALYTVHGHLSRLTWCRQVAASGVAPASARGPASATLAAHTGGTQHCTDLDTAFKTFQVCPVFIPFCAGLLDSRTAPDLKVQCLAAE